MKILGGFVVGVLVLSLTGCAGPEGAARSSDFSSSPAPSSSSPAAATVEPEPSPSETADESGFLASAYPHLVGTGLEAASDKDVVSIGEAVCAAFDRGATPKEIVAKGFLPPRASIRFMDDSRTYLCPEYADLQLPPLPKPPPKFPPGFPRAVPVSSLPEQPRSLFEGDYQQAVAVAPGVWAGLPPGATVKDVANGDTLEGYCASIKAYERKYTPNKAHAGSCF